MDKMSIDVFILFALSIPSDHDITYLLSFVLSKQKNAFNGLLSRAINKSKMKFKQQYIHFNSREGVEIYFHHLIEHQNDL